jgi:hypothetical protein
MTKLEPDKNKKRPQHVDFFIETLCTSNTASGIAELHKTTKFNCIMCKTCKVETKMAVLDHIVPTFVLHRKKYCVSCWLKLVL